jgi:hypothetical protein
MNDSTPGTIEVLADHSAAEVRFLQEISAVAQAPTVIPGDAQAPHDPVALTPEQIAHAARMARLAQANLSAAEAKRQRRQARNLLVQPRTA